LDRPILGENGNRNQPKITQKRDENNLIQPSKHRLSFKRGINAARGEKGAFFPTQVACSCLIPLPKEKTETDQLHAYLLRCCVRREIEGRRSVTTRLFKPKITVNFFYIYTWHPWCRKSANLIPRIIKKQSIQSTFHLKVNLT